MSTPGSPTGGKISVCHTRSLLLKVYWSFAIWLVLCGISQAELTFTFFSESGEANVGSQIMSFLNRLPDATTESIQSTQMGNTSRVVYSSSWSATEFAMTGSLFSVSSSEEAANYLQVQCQFYLPEQDDPVSLSVLTHYRLFATNLRSLAFSIVGYLLVDPSEADPMIEHVDGTSVLSDETGTWLDRVILTPGMNYEFQFVAEAGAHNRFADGYEVAMADFGLQMSWATVPEPSSLLLALVGVGAVRLFRSKRASASGNP